MIHQRFQSKFSIITKVADIQVENGRTESIHTVRKNNIFIEILYFWNPTKAIWVIFMNYSVAPSLFCIQSSLISHMLQPLALFNNLSFYKSKIMPKA